MSPSLPTLFPAACPIPFYRCRLFRDVCCVSRSTMLGKEARDRLRCTNTSDALRLLQRRNVMKGKNGTIGGRLPLALLLIALAALVTLLGSGTALAADRWSDITDAQWVSSYQVTAAQASTV